jgi:SAM-dependent methyltransferase
LNLSNGAHVQERRFEFGKNWTRFLGTVDETRIVVAEDSIRALTGQQRLDGLQFLDIGSGSGLSSLAARRLGAVVTSFDYDRDSVDCTRIVRDRYFPDDRNWTILEASVLDRQAVQGLGRFDIVYSWGVLHHTGKLWEALDNACVAVAPRGKLIVAIYNDQGRWTRVWTWIKRLYNALPAPLRFIVLWPAAFWLLAPAMLRDLMLFRPFATLRTYHRNRGMSPWRDVVDWVGGFPFEVAKPEEVLAFCTEKRFRLVKLTTCGGRHGCNEYVFAAEDLTV